MVKWFESHSGWTDPGEGRLVGSITDELAHARILDPDVGSGRTIGLMLAHTDSYVGLDFSQAMVDTSRRSYPEATMYCMDARDLSRFADESFDFVMFSWNGIDAVDHEGRGKGA